LINTVFQETDIRKAAYEAKKRIYLAYAGCRGLSSLPAGGKKTLKNLFHHAERAAFHPEGGSCCLVVR